MFQIICAAKIREYGAPGRVSLQTLAFADEENKSFALREKVKLMAEADIMFKCNDTADRLKSRCAGLLEVTRPAHTHLPSDFRVDFLHRTVKDFLAISDIWEGLTSRTSKDFDPNKSLLESFILQLKFTTNLDYSYGFQEVSVFIHQALEFARKLKKRNASSTLLLLKELDRTVTYHWTGSPFFDKAAGTHWATELPLLGLLRATRKPKDPADHDDFLSLAVEFNLVDFVSEKLSHNRAQIKKTGRPLLDYVVMEDVKVEHASKPDADDDVSKYSRERYLIHTEMVKLLLSHGANPNEKFSGQTVWQRWNRIGGGKDGSELHREATNTWWDTRNMFLNAGVDPHACPIRTEPEISVPQEMIKPSGDIVVTSKRRNYLLR